MTAAALLAVLAIAVRRLLQHIDQHQRAERLQRWTPPRANHNARSNTP